MQPDTPTNPALESIDLGAHFILRLGIQMQMRPDGTHLLQFDLGDRAADVGLIGLLADMAGGQTIIAARAPCETATTHLEVHGVSTLIGPGEIVANSRLLATSKRRGVIESHFRLGAAGRAVAHTTFAVRDGTFDASVMARSPRAEPSMMPLWQFIGVRETDAGAAVTLGPLVGNHTGALHGGAIIALAEAAALQQLQPDERLDGVSIHYLHAVHGEVATGSASRHGRSVVVDVHTDGSPKELARLLFPIA